MKKQIIDILQKTCRQRIEYIAVPLESASLTLPTPTPINVGGAIIFGIDIEQYKEYKMKLIITIIPDSVTDSVSLALTSQKFRVTQIASTGGFLKKGFNFINWC